jgi:predicted metal-dependent peptidase
MAPRKKKTKQVNQEELVKILPDQKLIEEKLTTARIGLLIRQPFFGSMATRLKLVRDDSMPTAATDGRHFYYNLEFIAGLTTKQTEFLFGHEVLHNVFEHHLRKEFPDGVKIKGCSSRHHMAWNIACDYVINNILIESNIGEQIEDTLYDKKYQGMCSEEVYDDLMKNCTEMDLCSLAEKLLDEHMDSLEDKGKGLSDEEKQQIKNEIKESLLASAQAAAGNVPMGVDRFIKSFTQPTLSWKEILRQDIQSVINKSDYTFYNPSKKGRQQGIVLPGMLKQNALDICIAIDTSGSISDEDLNVFLGEISGIMEQYEEYTIRLWSFDTKVYNDEVFRSDEGRDITEYKTKGGGGTLFECNWNYMKENDIQPKIFIMFTDMMPCGGWGDETYCDDVIFVGYKSRGKTAPFGTTITMS